MQVNENISFNAQVIVKVNQKDVNGVETGQTVDTQVMYLNATIDTSNMNININVSTSNKELVAANADTVKAQYTEFVTAVKVRAKELGYVIF